MASWRASAVEVSPGDLAELTADMARPLHDADDLDAGATNMGAAGMHNIGQLARERHADDGVVLVGFGSHGGTVMAGREWGAPMEAMTLPEAVDGSWEEVLHRTGGGDDLLLLDEAEAAPFFDRRGHRAVGVVYNPEREHGNDVPTVLPQRYDAFLFIDETQALHPLKIEPVSDQPPETYPLGF